MTTTNLEDTAAMYLRAEAEAKEAAKRAKDLKDELDALMESGQEISVLGVPYVWTVSEGRSPKNAEFIKWLHSQVTPDVQVMIEEGQEAFVGVRVTKSLKPAK